MVSRRWKYSIVLGNFMLAGMELAAGRTNNLGVLADAVHNAGDGVTYQIQAGNITCEQTPKSELNKRRIAHTALMASSATIAGVAAYELAYGAEHQAGNTQIAVAGASIAFNSLLAVKPLVGAWRRNRTNHTYTQPEKDILRHIALVDMPSSALALGGSLLSRWAPGLHAEEIAGIGSGSVGAFAFRPTKDNLGHVSH